MSSIVCLFVFILTCDFAFSGLTQKDKFPIHDEYKLVDGSLYLVTPSLQLTSAVKYCEEREAQLAYPRTEKETNDLAKFIRENYPSIQLVAIEILKRKDSNKFMRMPDYDDYEENQDEEIEEIKEIECGAINSKDGNIEAINCFGIIPALCRKKVRHDAEMCNTTDIHFEANPEKTACYKFYFKPLKWTDAKEQCEKENAHLAVLSSQEEADHLFELHYNSVVAYNIQHSIYIEDRLLWLGFTYSKDTHKPLSIFGKTLEEEGYSNWATHKGDTEGSQCGAINSMNGFLYNVPCNETHAFACKKAINASSVTFDDMTDKSAQFQKVLLAYFDRQSASSKKSVAVTAVCLLALCICIYIGYRIKIGDAPGTVRTVIIFVSGLIRRLKRNSIIRT